FAVRSPRMRQCRGMRREQIVPLSRCLLAAMLLAGLLGACDREQPARAGGNGSDDGIAALPRPDARGGSVTGFDDSAPPQPSPPVTATAASYPVAPDEDGGFDFATTPESATDRQVAQATSPAAPGPVPADEPGAADAAAVLRGYYGAIDAGQYPRAHAMWSDGGRASGQTAQQFAGGFSDTA